MRRVGIDIGGTFTDLVYWDDEAGRVAVHKLPSTPADPGAAGLAGLRALIEQVGTEPQQLDFLVHGTTVATNILLEKNGAKAGMITTRGFRDVLHIGRKDRPYNFSHTQRVPRQSEPLIRRRHRLPVTERISAPAGAVVTPLDEKEVRAALRQLKAQDIDALAICCLMSFLNPAHERRIRELAAEELPDVYLSVSHQVAPLYREYERFSTTALNAYVGPKTARYIDNFAATLGQQGFQTDLNLMTSAGGILPSAQAQDSPVSLLLSGPVGALIAGIEVGRQVDQASVITLDVGGTSADIGVAPNGELRMKHLLDTRVGDYDAMIPMADLDTIGAGGGSIAYVDEGRMFRVGPRSAGAQPGPACYGLGGSEPTVTDAMVALGWFRPHVLKESGLTIDPALAKRAIIDRIGEPLQLDLETAAAGIYRIAVNNMVAAIRVNSIAKGYDPRDFALVAYGGAGAAFAVEAAAQLAIPTVVIPARPGVGAAAGLLSTDTRFQGRTTVWQDLSDADEQRLAQSFADLSERITEQLRGAGFDQSNSHLNYVAECRYVGQGHELTVAVPPPPINADWIERVVEHFHQAHEQTYLRRFADNDVMAVHVGIVGIGQVPPPAAPKIAPGSTAIDPAAVLARQPVYFVEDNRAVSHPTQFIDRRLLKAGNRIVGPAIVEQSDTTSVLPPNTVTEVDTFGNFLTRFTGAPDA